MHHAITLKLSQLHEPSGICVADADWLLAGRRRVQAWLVHCKQAFFDCFQDTFYSFLQLNIFFFITILFSH